MTTTLDLATKSDRLAFYAQETGLELEHLRKIHRRSAYGWKRRANRAIAVIVLVLEGLWQVSEISAKAWLRLAERVLPVVRALTEAALPAVKALARKAATALCRFVRRHRAEIEDVVVSLAKNIADAVLDALKEALIALVLDKLGLSKKKSGR